MLTSSLLSTRFKNLTFKVVKTTMKSRQPLEAFIIKQFASMTNNKFVPQI